MRRVPPKGTEVYQKGKDAQAWMPHPPSRGIESRSIAGGQAAAVVPRTKQGWFATRM